LIALTASVNMVVSIDLKTRDEKLITRKSVVASVFYFSSPGCQMSSDVIGADVNTGAIPNQH